MKVLLVQPPHYYDGGSRAPGYFPLGLGYIAKSLLKSGHRVQVLDIWAHQYTNEDVIRKIKELDFDVVGISALSTQYVYVKWLITELKKRNASPVAVGNALATLSPEITLNNTEADICVIGEGETTFKEVVEKINDLEKVKGIYFKYADKISKNPSRGYIENLDTIDFPAWELFPMDIYLRHCRVYSTNIPAMNVVTARGCPYNCRFCSKTFRGVRLRSVNNIIDEIRVLIKKFEVRGIFFNDELVISNRKRIYELCDEIEPLGIKWNCQGRVNLVDLDILERMRRAGCVAVGYGIESGSQTILDNMNKQTHVEQSKKAIRDTIRVGMHPIIQMMYGYPGETRRTLQETTDFFKEIPFVGPIGLSVTTPLPGTELYTYSLGKGLIKDEEEYLRRLSAGYTKSDGTRPFTNFTEFDAKEFYRLKRYTETRIFLNQILRHPLSFGLNYLRATITRDYLRATITRDYLRATITRVSNYIQSLSRPHAKKAKH